MQRDMELIRKLVLATESSTNTGISNNLGLSGYTQEQIGYHSYLMIQAGLAEGIETTKVSSLNPQADLHNLTWSGHEFADAARDETRWIKAMGIIKEKSGTVTIGVLTQLLSGLRSCL
jgi:Hypothetical protein (DUF2513)